MVVSKVGVVLGTVLKGTFITSRILSTSCRPLATLAQRPDSGFTFSSISPPLNDALSRRFISKKSDKGAMKSPGASGSSKEGMNSPGATPSSNASGKKSDAKEWENAKLDEWQVRVFLEVNDPGMNCLQMEAVEGDRKWQQQNPTRGPGYTGKDGNKKTSTYD
ncbi:hypothetical protein RvY_08117 [Ramazzottius varieornatus]|uniref:Uncharacterized protein n=1 Tax=Ramazzottius varieornatus TaxID=947166 RepID=A0A1D1V9H2_RAMVA|nr:hypothetical protein RvY_08117 [Ramazzottius varieornatus]